MASATHARTTRTLPDVPDILYHVFSYLDPVHELDDDAVYESRRSLAIAARTCQGFVGPALDVLWRRLPDDQPLADLLCALKIGEMETPREDLGRNKAGRYRLPNQDEGGYRLSSAAEEYEERWRRSRGYDIRYFLRGSDDPRIHPRWPRFMEYASRVRSITLFSFDGPSWCGIWEDLRSHTGGAPILPKLVSVAFCHISIKAVTPGALALISPSVRRLNFNLESACTWPPLEDKLRCLFSQSLNSAPEIEKLRLELLPSILGAPLLHTHCSYVRHLEVFPQLDVEELRILSALPALQSLSISLSAQFHAGTEPPLPFETVTALAVQGTWPNLTALLDTVLLPSLHALSVTGWDYGEPAASLANAATHCFHTISAKHPAISSLTISASPGRLPPSRTSVAYGFPTVKDAFQCHLLDLIRPLLSLSALRHLSLGFPSYFDLACASADWRAVAESLRALEAFHLRIWPYSYFGSAIHGCPRAQDEGQERPRGGPLDVALAHFARCCPRLRALHLPAMELELREASTPAHDIFYHILSHLTPDPKADASCFGFKEGDESRSARKALGCLARTHTSFTQPALAEMWRSLPSKRPLEYLLCVVGIARRQPRGEWNGPLLELCGTPATHRSGWVRFQAYASLVRKIIVDPLYYHYHTWDINAELLEDTFWCQLLSACGDTPILPHLEGATVRSSNTPRSIDTGVLRLVNTSTVRDFDVAFRQSSQKELEQLGKALEVCFSSMQNLEVLSMEVPDLASFIDMGLLPSLHPHLRYVKLFRSGYITPDNLRLLANLPDLKYLNIGLLWDSEPLSFPVAFPQLRTLSVSCGDPGGLLTVLDHIDAPQLHTFTVSERHKQSPDSSQTLPQLLRALVTKCPSLTRFEWGSEQLYVRRLGFFGTRHAGAPLTSLVAPLLSHRAMRHFSVSFWGPIVPCSPDDFCAMAQAWPDLETFYLGDEWDKHYGWAERYADLESIAAFARHCPRLRSLCLPVVLFDSSSSSSSAFASEWTCRPPAPHWLRELSLDRVVCSVTGEAGDRSREDTVGLFRGLMEMVFRSATISIRCKTS
ncbi:hypothetical protein GSI_11526 [Ganoderma sinense ZZ0214-1]|uniref:F-box domain-containing protein n=1 Tax=Ganoderma sinense ZZ0214-1 TaxID=1077348 RepID=A0A2G8RW82_9APHY|nr:hypothetical protein GSI_11526 [Ganoderma sinense ZZ0214-1]